jgi:periplasmic protein TonB
VHWDSPFALAVAGTLAIHVLVVTAGDALVVTRPPRPLTPPPRVELVEVEVPPVVQPPPPPVPAPQAVEEVKPAPRPRVARTVPPQTRSAPPPPPETPTEVEPGGDQVVQMEDIAPSATGVAVAVGKRSTGHIGRGGSGGGTGAGSGSGTGEIARPVSVATIKTPARAKDGFDYASIKDYPAEARALGIEGPIRVRLVVDENGKVKSRVLLNKLGHGLDELALQRAAEIEFEPARDTDDKPVASVVVWTFSMQLPR